MGLFVAKSSVSEQGSKQMDTLTQLQQNRRIIHDLTCRRWQGSTVLFRGLAYLASLRDISTNVYQHAGLSAVSAAGCAASP